MLRAVIEPVGRAGTHGRPLSSVPLTRGQGHASSVGIVPPRAHLNAMGSGLPSLSAPLQARIDEFAGSEEAAFAPFEAKLAASPVPSEFWHYTTGKGLEGILEHGTIWLTNAFQLGDTSELRHAFSVMNRCLGQRAFPGAPPEIGAFADSIRRLETLNALPEIASFFVVSFSLNPDEITQWCRFADDARGYALIFDADLLEKRWGVQVPGRSWNPTTFPVSYDEAEIVNLIEPVIDLALPAISYPRSRAMSRTEVNAYMTHLQMAFTLAALRRNIFFKHGGYRPEAEYRFMEVHQFGVAPPDLGHRDRNGEKVIHRHLPWRALAPEALKAVAVGPASKERPAAIERARTALKRAGLPDIPIVPSTLPYKSFLSTPPE